MLAYTYIEKGQFRLLDKPVPRLQQPTNALVRVTLGSICTSDLHIKHGSVPRAVPGITVGHEMVGVVEEMTDSHDGLSYRVKVKLATDFGKVSQVRVVARAGQDEQRTLEEAE